MSLQVWLPLNGKLNNNGLSNCNSIISASGATVNNNGKIGKTYLFDANDDYISINTPNLYKCFRGGSQAFTIAMWVYTTEAVGNRAVLFGDYGLSGTIQFNIELNSGSNLNNDIRFYWAGSPDYRATGTNVAPNTWIHIAIVYDGTQIKFYRNGSLIITRSGTLTEKNKTSGDFYLGRDSRTGATAFGGYINDFRVYDEALSLKQVQDLSKALVCHYKLEGPGANPNLLVHGGKYTIVTPRVQTGTSTDGYGFPVMYYNGLDTSKYYIYSCCCDGTLASGHNGSTSTDPTKRYWTIWLYYSDTEYSDSSFSSYKTPVCYHSNCNSDSQKYLGQIGNRYYWRIKPSYANCSVRTNIYSNGTDSITVNFWNIKLEEGTQLTSWLPNSADSLYTALGYDNLLLSDVSGNGYNATKGGTLTFNNETPRYDGSTLFNSGYLHQIVSPLHVNSDAFTISCWFYPTVSGTQAIINDRTSTGEGLSVFYYSGTNMRFDTGIDYQWVISASALGLNKWNFLTFTWDKNIGFKKYYLNGDLINNTTDYGTLAKIGNVFSIGNSSTNGSAGAGNQVKGSISDFRIYATALSAEDIKDLYQTSGMVDKNSNVYAYEFKEE